MGGSTDIILSIIIVNFNTPVLTLQAVNSCERYLVGVDFEIIVVDNGSVRGSIEEGLMSFPEVHLIKSMENLGFGRANNLGFEYANGDYIFLLNSDAYLIDSLSVPAMIDYLEQHKDVGIVGPNFIKKDGSKNYAYGNLLGLRKMINDMGYWKIQRCKEDDYATFKVCDATTPKAVGYLAAAGIIIKRTMIEKYGLFDPKFFLYFEDMELGWRYSNAGIKSVLLPQSTLIHLGGGSSGTNNPLILKHILMSKKYYLKKTLGSFNYVWIRLLDLGMSFFKSIKRMFK
jgi:GT2 family glycosyltransferase